MTPARIGQILDTADLLEGLAREGPRARAAARYLRHADSWPQGRRGAGDAQVRLAARPRRIRQERVAEQLSLLTDGRVPTWKFAPPTLLGITAAEKLIKDDARAQAPKGKKTQAVEEVGVRLARLTTKRSTASCRWWPRTTRAPRTRRVWYSRA